MRLSKAMMLPGIGLVARQEIRTRLRTGRWRVLLGVWFVAVNGLGLLFRLSLEAEGSGASRDEPGVLMFGGILLAVLVLTLLVTPALSAQSINGDRERGTLATLQITRLSPLEIVLGKLAASWGTGLVVLGLTLPCALVPVAEGAITPGRAIVVIGVVGLLIGVVCAVSQAWSALVTRSITSVLLSYLTVFALLVGTPIVFGLATPLTRAPVRTCHFSDGGPARYCGAFKTSHTEYVWWLIAPNPLVVLADAAPRQPKRITAYGEVEPGNDPLGELGREVRDIRQGSQAVDNDAPVWPYGLAFNLALAGLSVWATTRRLRTPVRDLPRGVRLA